jgi:hypothetical protein
LVQCPPENWTKSKISISKLFHLTCPAAKEVTFSVHSQFCLSNNERVGTESMAPSPRSRSLPFRHITRGRKEWRSIVFNRFFFNRLNP